jgi:D-amino-acid oxidase
MKSVKLITRREAIKLAGMGLVSAAFAGACASKVPTSPPRPYREFPLVRVSEDRIIRQVAGLRPFRPSGFVVRRERIGDKDVIHNYGHGGGGITLSWGTSHIAMEKALPLGHRKCAVIGCGVIGLSTATLMQKKGFEVTIYAKDLPPETTSNIAGGLWSPSSVFAPGQITPGFYDEFLRASRLSYRYFQNYLGSYYGVNFVENYVVGNSPIEMPGYFYELADVYREVRNLTPGDYPFDDRYGITYTTLFIEPQVYLNSLTRDFRSAGGKIIVREFEDVDELLLLEEPLIMNCTGLGSYHLFNDHEMTPVKGQLVVLLPQPEVDYITLVDGKGLYTMPRTDGIILGGSWQKGDWTLTPDPEVSERIFRAQSRFWQGQPAV